MFSALKQTQQVIGKNDPGQGWAVQVGWSGTSSGGVMKDRMKRRTWEQVLGRGVAGGREICDFGGTAGRVLFPGKLFALLVLT